LLKIYLDSSALTKRYLYEAGSSAVDEIFRGAEAGELVVVFSIWNVGEVLGVLDTRCRRRWLSEGEFAKALRVFTDEIIKLLRLRSIVVVPAFTSILIEAWSMVLNSHIYEADALQLSTCNYSQSNAFLSEDGELVSVARQIGLKAFDVVREEKEVKLFIRGNCA